MPFRPLPDASGISFAFAFFVMEFSSVIKQTGLAVLLGALSLSLFLLFFPLSEAYGVDQEQEAKIAWKYIVPAIEVFWQEYQTSPEKLKEDAWPLISMLKNYIKAYPDSKMLPEAYYILGEAYASVAFWPEAEAHWKIVTRYFPNSKWTNQALNSLILYYEKTGNQEKLRRFYREIMRRFPDSIAARTAEVLMARQALSAGDVKMAKDVAKRVSRTSPMAEVDVPELLDLKARLALRDKKPKKAIDLWVRYLNLIRNPGFRASTLFRIGETYRRMGDVLKARKYYALIRRDFKGQPEYLFARFRMLELKEQARERLSRYTKGRVAPPDYYESEQVFKEILKRFPRHPLTREVKKEYVATELRKKDYLRALMLAERYLRNDPQSPYSKDILLMADEAKNGLLTTSYKIPEVEKIVDFAVPFLHTGGRSQVYDYIRTVAQRKWVELQKRLSYVGRPVAALKQYWRFTAFFQGNSDAVREAEKQAVKSLLQADETFLKEKKAVELLNFYFKNRARIDRLKVAGHYLCLARAESAMGLDEASLRAYQRAWDVASDGPVRCRILIDWTGQIIRGHRLKAAQDAITLMNFFCPEESMGAMALLYKSKMALWQKDYKAALNMALDSVHIRPTAENVTQAVLGAIYLADWNSAWKVIKSHGSVMPMDKKIILVKKWGDEALNLGQTDEALRVYRLLFKLDSQDPASLFRLDLAASIGKDPERARTRWIEAAKKQKGFWERVFKAEASYSKFQEKADSAP